MTRRDNGLPGGEWQRLADLAPPLADHVLEVLRDEGIAAYAAPATGRTGAYGETQAHPRPTDQVFVGRAQVERARAVLDELLPELDTAETEAEAERSGRLTDVSTDDEVWAGIVASYSAPPAEPVGRWSVAEDVTVSTTAGTTPVAEPAEDDHAPTPSIDDTASVSGPATGFEDIKAELDENAPAASPSGPADDPHDHYTPPLPPPLPEGDPVTRMAWVGVLGGPLFLILAAILGWGVGGFVGFCAVLAFVAGFITLVTRLGNDREDDGDDGAVV